MRSRVLTVAVALAAACLLTSLLPSSPGAAHAAQPVPAAPHSAASQGAPVAAALTDATPAPAYTPDGRLLFPTGYREWIFLSSGLDMSYSDRGMPGHSMFDNVFVDPGAYRAFLATGTWPDPTVLVLEVRGAATKGSINVSGRFQTGDRMGVEVHVKDTRHLSGGWAFFGFDDEGPAKAISASADCYSCHTEHASVDTTFVQFYPTLLPLARSHGTVKPGTISP